MSTVLQPAFEVPAPARRSSGLTTVTTLVLIGGAAACSIFLPFGWNWVGCLAAMFVFFLSLGSWISGRPMGILVSERNLMSLSRFQLVLWTLLVISAYSTMCLVRTRAGLQDALNVPIDWRLWAVMGISTASLVGTPLLLDSKKRQDPSPATLNKTAAVLNEPPASIDSNRSGTLYSNPSPADARLTDIFQGDEVGNTAYVDVAKLQMFFFTLVIAGSYAYQIFHAMFGAPKDLSMPGLSEGAIALLGISHAGYLAGKTADYTPPKN
jgi:hypothetical protein